MASIIVDVEKGIEIGAEDALKFLGLVKKGITLAASLEPSVVAALGTLLGAVSAAVTSTEAAASGGFNVVLDAAALASLKSVWPDLVTFASSLGIKL